MPDKNIELALDDLNNPQRRIGETRDEYKARLAASSRQRQGGPARNERVPEIRDQTRHDCRAEK